MLVQWPFTSCEWIQVTTRTMLWVLDSPGSKEHYADTRFTLGGNVQCGRLKSFRYLRSKLYLVDRLQEKAWRSRESHVAVIGHQIWAKKKDFIH